MGDAKKVWRKFRVVYEYEAAVDDWQGTLKQEKAAWKDHQTSVLGDKSCFRKVKFTIEEVK